MRETVDRACRKFSITRTWPKLNAEGLLFVGQRLALALSFLRLLQTADEGVRIVPDPDPAIPDRQVLEFLLVNYWHHAGYEQYLFQMTRLI